MRFAIKFSAWASWLKPFSALHTGLIGCSTLGAMVGGAVVGFVVFGYLGMRFFKDADGPLVPLLCALAGAVVGAIYQVFYGDLLWYRLWGRLK